MKTNKVENLINQLDSNLLQCDKCKKWFSIRKIELDHKNLLIDFKICNDCWGKKWKNINCIPLNKRKCFKCDRLINAALLIEPYFDISIHENYCKECWKKFGDLEDIKQYESKNSEYDE